MPAHADTTLWARLSVTVSVHEEEAATAAFLPDDAPGRAWGLVVEDAGVGALNTATDAVPDGYVRMSTYVPTAEADAATARLRDALQRLCDNGLLVGTPAISRDAVEDADWRERWKEFFHVTHVTARIVIRPPWRDYDAQPGEVVLDVEPGLAFGTGGHQTTQLSLRALERVFDETGPSDVLDVGCGSGVLAIAAVRLGAARAVAIDVDTAALEASQENAERNGVAGAVAASTEPLADVARREQFPLVLANIVSGTLTDLREDLVRALVPGGRLIVSGVLEAEEERFQEAFGRPPLRCTGREEMDGWLGLVYVRSDGSGS